MNMLSTEPLPQAMARGIFLNPDPAVQGLVKKVLWCKTCI